ncbi:hypothetical protein [Aurantivibrio infirmus]
MDKPTKYFRNGVKGLMLAFGLLLVIVVLSEIGIISDSSIVPYLIAIPANIGLFIWLFCGLYLWLHYFQEVRKTYNPFVILFYFATTAFGGYWAHLKLKNSGYVQTNI